MTDKSPSVEALRITGSVGTGKTHLLLQRARELADKVASEHKVALEQKDDGTIKLPNDSNPLNKVLVLCATPQAACAFSERLQQSEADAITETAPTTKTTAATTTTTTTTAAMSNITVTTPRALALSILSDSQAIHWSGREPRLLNAFEETFLLEDMKVCGLRPKRLREMIKFFYRSWTELADDNPNWLLPGEETDVHTLLKANLTFMRGMVEPEVANQAVRYLQTHEDAHVAHAYSHVLIDDYQCLSRASQALANMLATCSITIACDANAHVTAYDSYPYLEGIAEFAEMHPEVYDKALVASHRTPSSAACAQALLADPCMTAATFETYEESPAAAPTSAANSTSASSNNTTNETIVLGGEHPTGEFDLIARTVTRAIEQGTPAHAIAIATPNATWSRMIAARLRAQRLRTSELPHSQPIRGDIRDNALCIPARILTALNLVAIPNDAVAWRCWCGFGDYLANSAAIANMRTFAENHNVGLVEALEAIAQDINAANHDEPPHIVEKSNDSETDHVVGANRVVAAYQAGRTLIEHTQGLIGEQLLTELTRRITDNARAFVPDVLREVCLTLDDPSNSNSARAMAQRAAKNLLAPVLCDKEAVAIVPYNLLCGLSPDLLIVSGFVNGFIPCRDYFDNTITPLDKQEKMHAVDTCRVYSMVGKANKQLAVSYFTSTDLETAGKLKLKINRIRLEDGVRVCAIAPSEFLAKMTDEK